MKERPRFDHASAVADRTRTPANILQNKKKKLKINYLIISMYLSLCQASYLFRPKWRPRTPRPGTDSSGRGKRLQQHRQVGGEIGKGSMQVGTGVGDCRFTLPALPYQYLRLFIFKLCFRSSTTRQLPGWCTGTGCRVRLGSIYLTVQYQYYYCGSVSLCRYGTIFLLKEKQRETRPWQWRGTSLIGNYSLFT